MLGFKNLTLLSKRIMSELTFNGLTGQTDRVNPFWQP
jgi:hypothetical protein